MRRQRVWVLILALLVTAAALYMTYGERYARGGVILRFTDQHGLHRSDLPVLAGWVVALLACAMLLRRPRG